MSFGSMCRSLSATIVTSGLLAAPTLASASPLPDVQWELRGGDDDNHFFSPLRQIDEASVSRLGLGWSVDLPSADGPVGTPIVVDGVSYVSGTLNMVFAHDLRTGKLLWVYNPAVRFARKGVVPNWGVRLTRGVAYADGMVFENTGDCRLVAIDAKRGEKAWEAQVCPTDADYTITSAPRVGGGMVFVGPNNADYGTQRGYVDAYDAKTGRRLWRFHTIPGKGDGAGTTASRMAVRTWDPAFLKVAAGGSVWEDITYDADTGYVYLSVGGATPWNPAERGARRGDELFTNSIVALDAKTGRYIWHYKVTPGDGWNLEPISPKVLTYMSVAGKQRRVLMDAPKNGFFYVLDARTGRLVNKPGAIVPVNWAKEIDLATGRPVPTSDADYWAKEDGAVVYPSPLGAHNWNPMAYSPDTGLVYIPALQLEAKLALDRSAATYGGQLKVDMLYGLDRARFPLVAWDPVAQKPRWQTDGHVHGAGGVLATAGNLVFQGAGDGYVRAFRATDGKELWSYDTGGGIIANPVSVTIDGTQWLIVLSGAGGTSAAVRAYPQLYLEPGVSGAPRMLAFRLDGNARLPPAVAANPYPQPPLPRPDATAARRGQVLFETKGCDLCHGARAITVRGSVPDLRRSTAEAHGQFESIVRGGALKAAGMPQFEADISPDELALIHAFILWQAWDAFEAQSAPAKQ